MTQAQATQGLRELINRARCKTPSAEHFRCLLTDLEALLPALEAHVQKEVELAAPGRSEAQIRPRIVCLCGSTRFYSHFQEANYDLTMQGIIVLSVGFYPHAQNEMHGEDKGCTADQKIALDELHKRKIDLADEVFVLNVGGYIGESTRSEINYAIAHNKPIRWLERQAANPEAEGQTGGGK